MPDESRDSPSFSTGQGGDNLPRFQAAQLDFAAYIRHPERNPAPPGIERRRMDIYAGLFYRNIEGFLSGTFRVFRSITSDSDWHALVRDFVHRHRSQSPYFIQISEEFLEFLATERGVIPDMPFALELCHYEWVEVALDYMEDARVEYADNPPSIDDSLRVSPLARSLCYEYPVHHIGPGRLPPKPTEPTYLIVYRNRRGRVRFMESNVTTARLLQLVEEKHAPRSAFAVIADELQRPLGDIERSGGEIVERLCRHDILVRDVMEPGIEPKEDASGIR